jgi:hypothetical protein
MTEAFIDRAHYHAIQTPNFRTRGDFIRAIADLVESTVREVNGPVSVRQVYYRAVNATLVESGDKGYRDVQGAVKDGRLVGWIAWNVIEDRGRKPMKPYFETSVESALVDLAASYRLDRGIGQRFRVEVWLEQAALRNVVWPVCAELGVPLIVCGGFTSHDSLYMASERQRGYASNGQHGLILHLSDLDPSGVVMADTIREVVGALAEQPITVHRVGLTAAQASDWGLHPRELKEGDSRAAAYREVHGDFAYELDGLPAAVLQSLVREAIEPLIDWSARSEVIARETSDRARLLELIDLARGEDLI